LSFEEGNPHSAREEEEKEEEEEEEEHGIESDWLARHSCMEGTQN
jgi:hypothetical protein